MLGIVLVMLIGVICDGIVMVSVVIDVSIVFSVVIDDSIVLVLVVIDVIIALSVVIDVRIVLVSVVIDVRIVLVSVVIDVNIVLMSVVIDVIIVLVVIDVTIVLVSDVIDVSIVLASVVIFMEVERLTGELMVLKTVVGPASVVAIGAIVVEPLEDEMGVDAGVREDESDEKEEDKAVSGRERLRNAVESAARYEANRVEGEEVAEARASREEETVRRDSDSEVREADWPVPTEIKPAKVEEIEDKNVDS